MNCGRCKFQVSQDMKFALMKNICPACGNQLFSDDEMKDISIVKNKVLKQSFSIGFPDELSFDVALFVLNEIKNGIVQKYFDKMISAKVNNSVSEDDNVSSHNEDELPRDDFKDRIRAEIESEFPELQGLQNDSFIVRGQHESADDKARRLRDIARKAGRDNKQGAKVRRVDS